MSKTVDLTENTSKIKLLKLYELLLFETDIEHPISRVKLTDALIEMGIPSNVRTLSKDIQTLNENGYEVLSYYKSHEKHYYVPERMFSIPEIKILIDAVQASSFITEKKSNELIKKLTFLAGKHSGKLLRKNMTRFNTKKHTNESVLYIVDTIEEAIAKRQKVSFYYFDLNEKGERVYRKDENGEDKKYEVEPLSLVFNEDNYYLVSYSAKHPESIANYRVDRIERARTDKKSKMTKEGKQHLRNVSEYVNQVFKMYDGKLTDVVLRFDKSLLGVVYDKFGEDLDINKVNGTTCEVTVPVRTSPVFYSWIFQFNKKMKIAAPDAVIKEYNSMK